MLLCKKLGKISTKKGGGLIIRHGRIIRILRYMSVTVSEKRVKNYKRFFHVNVYTMIPMSSLRARVRESTTYTCLCWASRTFKDIYNY